MKKPATYHMSWQKFKTTITMKLTITTILLFIASITFGQTYKSIVPEADAFYNNKEYKKSVEKYGDDSYYDCRVLERFSYTENDRKMKIGKTKTIDNIISFTSGIYHGVHEFIFGVTWMFLPDEVESIYKELKELLE
jgi:predicted nucleotide-binding protein (sugar kinase/HSP70/actin superfamily)